MTEIAIGMGTSFRCHRGDTACLVKCVANRCRCGAKLPGRGETTRLLYSLSANRSRHSRDGFPVT